MSTDTPTQGFVLGSRLYDQLKFVAQILLPALATLVLTVGQILEFGDESVKAAGIITAVDFFLGTILKLSTKNYVSPETPIGNFVVITQPDGKKTVRLGDLNRDPATLVDSDVIRFKLVHELDEEKNAVMPEELRDENSP